MNNRGNYKTKQYDELLEYLSTIEGKHFNVCDIHDHFLSSGKNIGTTTIYRQLDRMVDEGLVAKYVLEPGSPACFEYMSPDKHVKGEVCFHLRCEVCGRLIHMHCDELDGITDHIMEEHGFRVNPLRTVFYGVCQECMEDDEEGKKLCR
ncbi:MAG: transcriptional repressor [Saccharofermentans sp.]|nr:transcriptional repressor [Saccharofermentans sp.]